MATIDWKVVIGLRIHEEGRRCACLLLSMRLQVTREYHLAWLHAS